MANPSPSLFNQKFLVSIFSDANFLAISLLENLLAKNCFVNIYTDEVSEWRLKTAHLITNKRFSVLGKGDFRDSERFNYAIFLGGFIKKEIAYKECRIFLKARSVSAMKTLVVLPLDSFVVNENAKLPISDNLAIVYLGDLLGPRFDLKSNLFISGLINEILTEKSMTTPSTEFLHPIFVSDAARTLTGWLFSFGPYGKETLLIGPDIDTKTFWQANRDLVGEIKLIFDNSFPVREIAKNIEIKRISCDLRFALMETYRWFSVAGTSESRVVKRQTFHTPRIKKTHKYPKFLRPSVILLGTILLFPFVAILISAILLFASYKQFIGGSGMPQNYILIAKTFSVIAESESGALSFVPGLSVIYRETAFAGNVGARGSDLALNFASLTSVGSELLGNILGDKVYDITGLSDQIKSDLSVIYRDTSLLEADAKSAKNVKLAGFILAKVDFEKIRSLVSGGSILADKLPVVLGKDQRKTYLVLFENNMELRPTGGFIGSFGLLTFDGGRLSDMNISDVYSADGQLNGHVEPPFPIKKYLNEANWWLRDSNWDPDFPTSAKRAEWFLDKELGQDVDGVVSVDLSPIQGILRYTGPIFLADYNLSVGSNNLYEETQSEVQDNFFPGSHKKASFLTALSQALSGEIGKMSLQKEMGVLKVIFDSLEGRHIQLFLHDDSQSVISALGWDGAISIPDCGSTCYQDYTALVEANLGVNKANYFVSRSVTMNVAVGQSQIDRTLTLNLANSASPSLGLNGKYKVYVRLIVPDDADVGGVLVTSGQDEQRISPEIVENRGTKEVGLLVEILGGQKKKISFSWSTVMSKPTTSYALFFRKQAGIDGYPVSFIMNPEGKKIVAPGVFSLTSGGSYLYNTDLARDFSPRFSWQR